MGYGNLLRCDLLTPREARRRRVYGLARGLHGVLGEVSVAESSDDFVGCDEVGDGEYE